MQQQRERPVREGRIWETSGGLCACVVPGPPSCVPVVSCGAVAL